jgi:hypothetical protein
MTVVRWIVYGTMAYGFIGTAIVAIVVAFSSQQDTLKSPGS